MKLLSLAKLNLYLEILGRESDGYHNIESIMQTISLSDTVIVEPSSTPGISISTNLASLPTDEKIWLTRQPNSLWKGLAGCLKV